MKGPDKHGRLSARGKFRMFPSVPFARPLIRIVMLQAFGEDNVLRFRAIYASQNFGHDGFDPALGLAVIAVVFAEAFWFARPAVVREDSAALENHLVQKLRDAEVDHRLGSAALVLVQGGKIAAEHGFGVANAETQAPVKTDQTLFQLASVSKAVTAWGVLELVEEGKLSLDDPVMRYLKRWRFPGSDAHRDKVTIRHLLSHTAGLDDGSGYGSFLPGEAIQTAAANRARPDSASVGGNYFGSNRARVVETVDCSARAC